MDFPTIEQIPKPPGQLGAQTFPAPPVRDGLQNFATDVLQTLILHDTGVENLEVARRQYQQAHRDYLRAPGPDTRLRAADSLNSLLGAYKELKELMANSLGAINDFRIDNETFVIHNKELSYRNEEVHRQRKVAKRAVDWCNTARKAVQRTGLFFREYGKTLREIEVATTALPQPIPYPSRPYLADPTTFHSLPHMRAFPPPPPPRAAVSVPTGGLPYLPAPGYATPHLTSGTRYPAHGMPRDPNRTPPAEQVSYTEDFVHQHARGPNRRTFS